MSEPITKEWLEECGFTATQPSQTPEYHGLYERRIGSRYVITVDFNPVSIVLHGRGEQVIALEECWRENLRSLWHALTGESLDPVSQDQREAYAVASDYLEENGFPAAAEALRRCAESGVPQKVIPLSMSDQARVRFPFDPQRDLIDADWPEPAIDIPRQIESIRERMQRLGIPSARWRV